MSNEPLPKIQIESIPGTLEMKEAPPDPQPSRFFDIPLGTDQNRLIASIPFGLSEDDYEMLMETLTAWKPRLVTEK